LDIHFGQRQIDGLLRATATLQDAGVETSGPHLGLLKGDFSHTGENGLGLGLGLVAVGLVNTPGTALVGPGRHPFKNSLKQKLLGSMLREITERMLHWPKKPPFLKQSETLSNYSGGPWITHRLNGCQMGIFDGAIALAVVGTVPETLEMARILLWTDVRQ
jgi:hypothetical protein